MERLNIIQCINKNKLSVGAYGGLVLSLVIFTVIPPMHGQNLWTTTKLSILISDVIVLALLSIGAIFIYSLGNMDISIGKQVGLYATLMVVIGNKTGSLALAVVVCLIIAVIIAVINGAAGDILKIHPIVSSLVFMMILGGVSSIFYNLIGSRNVSLREVDYSIFKNVWFMVIVLISELLVVTYLFNYTKFGKYSKAIGANQESAKQSGIHVIKYKIISYMIMGLAVVLASLFQMGYTGSASDATGTGFEMNVMVALILGGMPLSGGMQSKVRYAVIGSFTYSLLNIGLPMIGVEPNQVFIIKALIFLCVVLVTSRKPKGILAR